MYPAKCIRNLVAELAGAQPGQHRDLDLCEDLMGSRRHECGHGAVNADRERDVPLPGGEQPRQHGRRFVIDLFGPATNGWAFE